LTRTVPAPGSDAEYIERFVEAGWDVTLVDDNEIRDVGRDVVAGFDLVLVSSSVDSGKISWRLRKAPEPVVVAEHRLFKSFHFTATSGSTVGLTSVTRKLTIVDPASPLVAGLTGEPLVLRKAKPLNYAMVGGEVHVAAVAKDDADQAVLFSFDAGDELATGEIATGRRVGIHMGQPLPGLSTGEGWLLFDAAVAWASDMEAPSIAPNDFPPIEASSGTHLGANVSKGASANRYEAIQQFEAQLGRQLSIINRFQEFSAGLTSSFYWERLHVADGPMRKSGRWR